MKVLKKFRCMCGEWGQNLKEWAMSESGWFPPYVDPVSPTQVALHNLIPTDIFFFFSLRKTGH